MKRKSYVFSGVIIVLAATSLAIGAGVRNMHSLSVFRFGAQRAAQAVSWVPYQISYKQYGSEPDYAKKPDGKGAMLVLGEIVSGIKSDGSRAEWETSYRVDGAVDQHSRTVTRSDGVRVRSYDDLGMMTAIKNPQLGNALARQALDPSQSCAASYGGDRTNLNMLISRESMAGYETYKITIDMKIARRTLWRAPALGCADLRDLFEKLDQQSGRVVAVGDRVAVAIRQGEPDASLFQVPVGFRNVLPSELLSARAAHCCNKKLSDSELLAIAPRDEEFRKLRFDP